MNGTAPERASAARRAATELDLAERWVERDPRDRRLIARALVAAVVLHVTVLGARMPGWGPDPRRIDAPLDQAMQVQFLKPPPPPPPKAQPKPKPAPKKIPRPDPTPAEPEPIVAAPEPLVPPEAMTPPPPQPGPVRVQPGQGPGLIKRVEPVYPPPAQAARLEGTVVLDAIIRQDGTVSDIKVIRSANPLFERAAIDALRQWRFTPFPYDVILTVTVNFNLRK